MTRFTAQILKKPAPAGEIMRQVRTARHLTLWQVAKVLKIPARYLEALEAGDWDSLPAGDYGRYFLKKYAQFLNLETEEILAQYPGPNLPQMVQPPKHPPINSLQVTHPLRSFVLLLAALVVVIYLVAAARAIFLPPQLTILSPSNDGITSSPTILLSGLTEAGIEVTVNNEAVEVMESGRFAVPVSLRPGLNILVVRARKNLSREVAVERRIYYSPTAVNSTPSSSQSLK